MQPRKSATRKKVERRGPYARGLARRKTLLEAVLRIVTREGVAGVTHRAVAAESKASLRATTYYFATKEDMIREAFRFFCQQSLEQIEALEQLRWLEAGLSITVVVVDHQVVGIDTPEDYAAFVARYRQSTGATGGVR